LKEDVVTFIQWVDEIALGADKEWVLTMANLLGGSAAPLARWIRQGCQLGRPLTRRLQTLYAAYKKLEKCCQ